MAERSSSSRPVTAQMSLRAPRVAIVVPGGSGWQFGVRRALHAATQAWGGAGFVVVPHDDDGEVPAVLAAAVREYDPDYVLRLYEDLNAGPQVDDTDPGEIAWKALCSVCSNYWSFSATLPLSPNFGSIRLAIFEMGTASPLTSMDEFGETASGLTVGAVPGLNDCLGVAAASTWGQRAQPITSDHTAVDERIRRRAIYALLSGAPPDDLHGVTNVGSQDGRFATDFARTRLGLGGRREAGPDQAPAVVVWGDSATDFALALTWDRTYGQGIWLPDEWWSTEPMRENVALAIGSVLWRAAESGRRVVVTSLSLGSDRVSERIGELAAQIARAYPDVQSVGAILADFVVVSPESLSFSRYNKWQYTVRDQYATQWPATATDDNGSLTLETLPPVPAVDAPELRGVQALSWQVEMILVDHDIPGSRTLLPRHLLRAGESLHQTHVRSSRAGIVFESRRFDFIDGAASTEWRLARPKLRFPSLADWAHARAQLHQLTTSLSTPGAHAELLAGLLGSRDDLADLFAGPLGGGLRAFVTATRKDTPELPCDHGWIVKGEAFLTFQGICEQSKQQVSADMRDRVDHLIESGLLFRGLMLNCSHCTHTSFVALGNLASTFRCQRCLHENSLARARWKDPLDEPRWFYDLHPTARTLIDENGHVPLLLSRHLRTGSRSFADCAEFKLIDLTDEDNPDQSETDLLVLTDRRLAVAEAKSNNTLGSKTERNKAVEKRVHAADVLQADEIIMATTQKDWESASITAMVKKIRFHNRDNARPIRLRTITGLGGDAVADGYLPI